MLDTIFNLYHSRNFHTKFHLNWSGGFERKLKFTDTFFTMHGKPGELKENFTLTNDIYMVLVVMTFKLARWLKQGFKVYKNNTSKFIYKYLLHLLLILKLQNLSNTNIYIYNNYIFHINHS